MTAFSSQPIEADDQSPPWVGRGISIRGRRAAFWAFVAAQLVIFVLFLWNFHGRWFIADEWDFLAGRTAGNIGSLFRPHQEHWSTLPILYYRLLWVLVGIRSYVPYLVSVLVLHAGVSSLLRATMIRARVSPWVATLVALVFTLYGAGSADIDYPFNIGFDGSIAFGLTYLILVDHDGPANRRDAWGMATGLAALMCSGIGVPMVIAMGIAVLLRNGVRRALLHAVPLACIYLIWYTAIGHTGYPGHSSLTALIRFAALGLAFTFSSLGHSPIGGVALAILLAAGVSSVVRNYPRPVLRTRYSVPCALLVGAVLFWVLTGYGRANNSLPSVETYAASRYLYVAAAMAVPAIAVAASQLISRRMLLAPLVVAVLVVGVPGNIVLLRDANNLHTLDSYRQFLLSVPRLLVAPHVSRSVRPDPYFDPDVTVGWLLDGVRAGRIPPPSPAPSKADAAYWTLELAWRQTSAPDPVSCSPVSLPATMRVETGATMTIRAPAAVTSIYRPGRATTPLRLSPGTYRTDWPFLVRVTPSAKGQGAEFCSPQVSSR